MQPSAASPVGFCRVRRPLAALALAGLSAACASCAEFDDPSTLKDLRLLAASLDPPEIILDPAAPNQPLPAIQLMPLLVDAAALAPRPISFSLRACANDPLAPSAPGAGGEAAGNYPAGGARSSVGSARCPADGATSWALPVLPAGAAATAGPFAIPLTADAIAAAFRADVFPGHLGRLHGGFDLGLPITLELTASVGGQSVTGLKRLIVWPAPLGPQHRANQNPRIEQIVSYRDRDPVTLLPTSAPATLTAVAPLTVRAGDGLWLQPGGAIAEPYLTSVVDRYTDETRVVEVPAETLRYSFYATAGKFDPRETTSELGFGAAKSARVPIEARYLAPAAADLPRDPSTGAVRAEVRVFIVVRDERGGASWIERGLTVVP